MASNSGLLRCPKNLKECMDWVLRATGKDNGTDNINNLKKALNAELKDFDDSNDLTQLVHGLCLFMGYPSCLCSLKVNVNESLKDISRKLKKDFKAVQSCVSILNFDLNCNSCNSNEILCKCCVISCIKEVKKCGCLKNPKQKCHCKDKDVSCAKVLSGLEACLHLQCLQSDMEDICKCNDPEKCCKSGTCDGKSGVTGGKSCPFCETLQSSTPVATTGLGLSPPNPIRLAKRLEKFFGNGRKGNPKCSCKCGSKPDKSCCCLACESNKCSEACSCNTSGCSCDKVPKKPSECPRKKFCSKINSIKIAAESTERTCCKGGTECHCKVDGSGSKCNSGQCCVVSDSKGSQQGVKCMIRRLVRFFTSFDPSKPDCPKLCCEIFCVLKCCDFLKTFYGKGKKDVCWTCKSGGTKGKCKGSTLTSGKGGPCCGGNPSKCSKSNCCQGCQDCDAIKFRKALQTLQYSGPCGQELYRLLDGLLNFCSNVFWPYVDKKEVKEKIEEAKKKCDKCSQKTSGTPCTCSDCDGCKALRGHNDIMSILRHGYVSSYTYKFESYFDPPAKGTYASWNSLCPSGSKCCSNPSCSCPSSCSSSNPSSCDPSQCCPDCPQRKAAKIFLGFLPCLYYGLKILHARCKYGSGFAGWHDITMDSKGLPSSGLAKFFFAWGYGLRPLISKKGSEFFPLLDSLSTLKVLEKFSTLVTENYFTSNLISPPKDPKTPSTVRSMLLWLYGLPFTSGFHDLVSHCSSLCSPFGNSFNSDAFCYYIYTCCFLLPVAIISLIEDSSSAQKVFSSSSEWKSFSYPEDLSSLFEKLCDYVRKIFVALNFLYFQCERNAGQGGWNDCAFGRQCVKALKSSSTSVSSASSSPCCSSSDPSNQGYLCTAINKDPVHDHCQKGSCRGFPGSSGKCSVHTQAKPGSTSSAPVKCTPCPHPLQRFLCHSKPNSDSESYPFGLSDITPMGFSKDNLPQKARHGRDLYHAIYGFCKDGYYPLTRLVQFILCVSRHPPETLGELFAFFVKFKDSGVFRNNFVQWIEGEPGFYSGEDLKNALEKLYGSHSGSHPSDLKSLHDCSSTKDFTCGKYLHALTEEAYNIFIDKFADTYLSYVCHLTKDFEKKLRDFYNDASTKFKTCCLTSCTKIVECPCALPFIYSWGFTFNSPKNLNCVTNGGNSRHGRGGGKHSEGDSKCTQKSCADFVSQLEKVAGKDSPLSLLLSEIERFIWSIRLPFFFGFIYVWFFVLSYFCYVILIKLDTFHTGSHLHLPRSFKILPSTLFSDASSKLKDLSYFTL